MATRDASASERGPHTLQIWSGIVVGVDGDDVFVELGERMQGVLSLRAFATPPALGQEFDFTLGGREEGLWALSLSDRPVLPTWENMEVGSLVHAKVVRLTSGGLEVKVGRLHGFLPRSQSGLARGKPLDLLVGKSLMVEVIEIDRERQRVTLSHKKVLARQKQNPHERAVGSLRPGQVVQGRVVRIEAFGAFLRFGRGLQGLIHVSDLSHERVEHPREHLALGDVVEAKVLYIRKSGKRISLGLKQMQNDPWKVFAREHAPGQLVEGSVRRVLDYGAFVLVAPGIEGLLHRSEMGLASDLKPQAVLRVGDPVSVRILDVDVELARLSLSWLHPTGSRIELGEARALEDLAEMREVDPGRLTSSLGSRLQRALGAEGNDRSEEE